MHCYRHTVFGKALYSTMADEPVDATAVAVVAADDGAGDVAERGDGRVKRGSKRGQGSKRRRDHCNIVEGRKRAVDGKAPQKRFFRQRAHCNPLAFNESFD